MISWEEIHDGIYIEEIFSMKRQQGIATKLIKHAVCTSYSGQGAKWVEVQVQTKNRIAREFYTNLQLKKCNWWHEGLLMGEGGESGIQPDKDSHIMRTTSNKILDKIEMRTDKHEINTRRVSDTMTLKEMDEKKLLEGAKEAATQVYKTLKWKTKKQRAECLYNNNEDRLKYAVITTNDGDTTYNTTEHIFRIQPPTYNQPETWPENEEDIEKNIEMEIEADQQYPEDEVIQQPPEDMENTTQNTQETNGDTIMGGIESDEDTEGEEMEHTIGKTPEKQKHNQSNQEGTPSTGEAQPKRKEEYREQSKTKRIKPSNLMRKFANGLEDNEEETLDQIKNQTKKVIQQEEIRKSLQIRIDVNERMGLTYGLRVGEIEGAEHGAQHERKMKSTGKYQS